MEGDGDRPLLPVIGHLGLEPVHRVRGVGHRPDPAVRVGHAVAAGHLVTVSGLLPGLGVPRHEVRHGVAKVVVGGDGVFGLSDDDGGGHSPGHHHGVTHGADPEPGVGKHLRGHGANMVEVGCNRGGGRQRPQLIYVIHMVHVVNMINMVDMVQGPQVVHVIDVVDVVEVVVDLVDVPHQREAGVGQQSSGERSIVRKVAPNTLTCHLRSLMSTRLLLIEGRS